MIQSVSIDNFKSLVDFNIELSNFNVLVGLNGAGKSTVLQGIDLLSQMMQGEIDQWLTQRQWESSDLNSKLSSKKNIAFTVKFALNPEQTLTWTGSFNLTSLHCTTETVKLGVDTLLQVQKGTVKYLSNKGKSSQSDIMFTYQGSILSALKEHNLDDSLLSFKQSLLNVRSLDLLSPEQLRAKSISANGKLGLGGERLSAFLHEIKADEKNKISSELKKVYSQLASFKTKALSNGEKQLDVTEKFGEKDITTSARHLNDGMLRLLAVLSQIGLKDDFLLFDEIENGINPELIEFLIDHLVNAKQQVMLTTHSPLVLNFIEDDVAKQSVTYLYKTSEGKTKAIKLFDIPSIAEKLSFMGPGEAFIDTDMLSIWKEIVQISEG
ncbi:AAA family ATPase [Vibrio rarus]|uniref:AAA family ATPase n=1 Tax=Vibrio rarus TaxID=413403 RepID=UPI0021C306C9|nr:ATP-binding protein [Vibrio rarus]